MDKKYLIGEFSDYCGVSKRMLRYYDKINILKPMELDEENGYRYYNISQINEIKKIRFLQELGFTLNGIHTFLSNPIDSFDFLELLKNKEMELTKTSDEIKSSLLLIKRTIIHLENQSPKDFSSIDKLINLEGGTKMSVKEQTNLINLKTLMKQDIFTEKIEEIIEANQNTYYHFITFDIDYFMHVNDVDGYEVGDAVLANVFTIISDNVHAIIGRTEDEVLLTRLGGDEFSVFVRDSNDTKILECIEVIYHKINSFDFKTIGCSRAITISCGIASHSGKPIHPMQLRDESIKAIIQAKRDGRNRYVIFN